MNLSIPRSIEILERTPYVLEVLLRDLPPFWTENNEGPETWSPYDIIGHLIHGERADWIERMQIILSSGDRREFKPFDRFAQLRESKGKSLTELLSEFKTLRAANVATLRSLNLTDDDLKKTGTHPALGEVTLAQLLATWTVHDLDHISQISRVMAKQYIDDVGPWKEYLKVLRS
ncbi:MAG: DinB family protein [bacterium]|nr:DinB family protein [bacterium]